MSRAVWALLLAVAVAAAVLSFSSLAALARLCGFTAGLAWLLPVVVDAGAAAGCLVWLGGATPERARRFARALTVVLLVASVAGNAVVHGLAAYRLAAPWWLVVAVSGVAPAVLGAVVHLAVLVSQARTEPSEWPADGLGDADLYEVPADPWADAPYTADATGRAAELIASGVGRRRLAAELGITEHEARQLLAGRNGSAVAS